MMEEGGHGGDRTGYGQEVRQLFEPVVRAVMEPAGVVALGQKQLGFPEIWREEKEDCGRKCRGNLREEFTAKLRGPGWRRGRAG